MARAAYRENWEFFKTLRDSKAMEGRGLVVTNKDRLDETVGPPRPR